MQDRVSLTIYNIGGWLERRRSSNQQTVLLLGSRAGALYRSFSFYAYCQEHTPHNLQMHSPIWSFSECYRVLLQKRLGERELHALLQDAFKNTSNFLGIYDLYFAEIIKRGYFREVISTNIDDIVERALHNVELIEDKDFEVLIPEKQSLAQKRALPLPYRLTKVFGDSLSREYTIYNRQAYFVNHQALSQHLRSTLSSDVLAIGIDPLWDRDILPFLYDSPKTLWFVNEEENIIHDPQIASILNQKKSGAMIGQNHGYKEFFQLLYPRLCMESGLSDKTTQDWQASSTIKEPDPGQRGPDNLSSVEVNATSSSFSSSTHKQPISVMYIYGDDDLVFMEQLWKQLHILKRDNLITEWHRGLLMPGDHLQLTQERELRHAQLIFVGFSSGFLTSEYYDQALQALKLSHEETVTLVPLLLRPAASWKQTPFSAIFPLPREGKPLSEMTAKERESVLSKIADDIRRLVQRLQKG